MILDRGPLRQRAHTSIQAIGLTLLAALAFWVCNVEVQRGHLPEAPPPDQAVKGFNSGYTVIRFPSRPKIDAYSRLHGVEAYDGGVRRLIEACVVSGNHTVALPADLTIAPVRFAADTVHEFAHI